MLLKWNASPLDTNVNLLPYYSLWRAIPIVTKEFANQISLEQMSNREHTGKFLSENFFGYSWQWIGNQPSLRLPNYSYAAPTLYDSSSRTNGKHYYMVVAHTSNPNEFYLSNVDSGHSVDNIPPFAPQNLLGQKIGLQVFLRWNKNSEQDIQEYVLYRSLTPNINPNLIAPFSSTSDTVFTDTNPLSGQRSYYIVCAKDIHDNLSTKSNEVQIVFVGVNEIRSEVPKQFSLYKNYPNPFNPKIVISYTLFSNSIVTLKVLDVLGREVITLLQNEKIQAGKHEIQFNASKLSSGIYFYRIDAGNFTQTKKLIILK